jgi:hypothetical protein
LTPEEMVNLVASVFLCSSMHVLFCVLWTHEWELLLITCLVYYYAARIYSYFMRSEIVMPSPLIIYSFACSLSVNIAYDAKLYTIIPEQMPYSQGLHCHTLWLSAVTFVSPISLSYCAFLCSTCFYFVLDNVSIDILGGIDDTCLQSS